MLQPYVMAYYIPLFMLWSFAMAGRNKDYTFITSVSVLAFVVTRLITYLPEGDRIMLDFANDLGVCLSLIYLQRKKSILEKSKIIPFLILTYAAMMVSYIFYISGAVTNTSKTYMLEAISVVQLLLIFGGMIYGTRRNSNNPQYITDHISNSGTVFRDKVDERHKEDVEGKKSDIPFKSGTHASLAEDS